MIFTISDTEAKTETGKHPKAIELVGCTTEIASEVRFGTSETKDAKNSVSGAHVNQAPPSPAG